MRNHCGHVARLHPLSARHLRPISSGCRCSVATTAVVPSYSSMRSIMIRLRALKSRGSWVSRDKAWDAGCKASHTYLRANSRFALIESRVSSGLPTTAATTYILFWWRNSMARRVGVAVLDRLRETRSWQQLSERSGRLREYFQYPGRRNGSRPVASEGRAYRRAWRSARSLPGRCR